VRRPRGTQPNVNMQYLLCCDNPVKNKRIVQ
jgi:hypothetical protein